MTQEWKRSVSGIKTLIELQQGADLDILEGLLKKENWNRHVREDTFKVVDLNQQTKTNPFYDWWAVE